MKEAIEPGDVYEKVEHLYAVVVWLARLVGLLCALIVAKIAINSLTLGRVNRLLGRVEALLTLNEKHGAINDDRTREIKAQAVAVAEAATAQVKAVGAEIKAEVPPAVLAAIKRDSASGEASLATG